MHKSVWGLLLAAALPLVAAADVRPTVVELFTSEGCNSCPPSEALIGTLASRPDVIALAYHVDYWDYIGWRDRFEIPQAAQRQRQYAKSLKLASVYTPQLVIDGQRDQVGSHDPSTIAKPKAAQGCALQITVHADQLQIKLGASSATAAAARQVDDVVLVSYLLEGSSNVTRGENAGHELHEFNIVRSVQVLGHWNGDAQSFSVPLKSLPSDATQVAVLVQAHDQGPITGATTHAVR